jgi:hypothetical protein
LLFPYGYTCIPTHDHTYCTIYQLSILHIYYEGLDTALPYVAGFVPVGDGPGMLNEEEVVSKYVRPCKHHSRVHEKIHVHGRIMLVLTSGRETGSFWPVLPTQR